MSDPVETEILRVGAQGDGIADGVDGPIFVPQGLPGERWRLIDGRAAKRLSSSPSRQQPVCAHFSECGGCSAQHMATDFYSDWKVEALRTAFAHRGIDTTPEPMRRVGAHTRRRATFSFARVDGKCAFGFHRAGDKALVDVFECPVLAPAIIEALPDLRALAATLARVGSRSEKGEGRMVVTALDHGLDIAITYERLNLAPAMRTELSERALAAKALSLQINGDLIVQTQAPVLTVNGAQLEAQSGVFLQAVPEAEQTIVDLCIHATKKAKKVADLFSGIGTFTFPLARSARVHAFDSDVAAINSLSNSVK
nr:class I SAM-dependent RNA methyltransferase [Alphaproteobacteria bacterium]